MDMPMLHNKISNPRVYNIFAGLLFLFSALPASAMQDNSTAATKPDDSKIIVAIIDSGIDYHHEDLRDVMWVNQAELDGEDFVDDDGNGCDYRTLVKNNLGYYPGLGGPDYENDKYMRPDAIGHGTHVAGIIGAIGDNGVGINGISQHVQLMALTFINPGDSANMADAALAIRYAVDHGAQIINCSFGQRHLDEDTFYQIQEAVLYAESHGVLIIAAAGNAGNDIDVVDTFFPANLDNSNIVAVTAADAEGTLWTSSNYGSSSIDIAAPGVGILSTVPNGSTSLFRTLYDPSGYLESDGTSVATAHISGILANLLYDNPGADMYQLKNMLLDQAVTHPSLIGRTLRGGYIF